MAGEEDPVAAEMKPDRLESRILDYLLRRHRQGGAKTAVYVVRRGKHAPIKLPKRLDAEVDYYCFTDCRPVGLAPWIFRFLPKSLSQEECRQAIADSLKGYERVVDADAPDRDISLVSARELPFFRADYRSGQVLGSPCSRSGFGGLARRWLKRLFRRSPLADEKRFEDIRPVTVIIPVYNGYDVLRRLMQTFFRHTSPIHQVIFVDDASPDPRVRPYLDELRKRHANVTVVANDLNRGFSHNVNLAVSMCAGDFVLLNTDTEVPDRWIPRLFAPMWARPDSTASVSAMTTCTPALTVPERDSDGLAFAARQGAFAIDRALASIVPDFDHDVVRTGVGFCLAISRKAWLDAGEFAEAVFGRGYGEETDWCYRARRCGYECRVAANLFVPHYHNGSFTTEEKQVLLARNAKLVKERNPEAFDRDLKFRCEFECARLRAQARRALRQFGLL